MIALFKAWLSKSWNLLGYQVSKLDPYQIYVFHDLVFQDMNTRKWLSRLGKPISEIYHFLFKTWHAKFWNVTLICKSMFPSLDNDCTIQDLAFQVLNFFGVINFNIRPKKELCLSWLGLPRHEPNSNMEHTCTFTFSGFVWKTLGAVWKILVMSGKLKISRHTGS